MVYKSALLYFSNLAIPREMVGMLKHSHDHRGPRHAGRPLLYLLPFHTP